MRGSGRSARAAASLIVGMVWRSRVWGPVTHVMVPSASWPVTRRVCGPNAATKIEHGVAFFTYTCPPTRTLSPEKSTGSPRSKGARTVRNSRKSRTG